MNFLEKLDYMMQKLAINKSKLSQLSGIPYTTIDAFYKKGFENTKMSTIRKLADALDVSLDYLIIDSITDEEYGKTNGFQLKAGEMEHIKKYRALDPYGKDTVEAVLAQEHKRCLEQVQASEKPQLYLMRRVGRDGIYEEHWMTGEEVEALKAKIDSMDKPTGI